MCIFYLVVLAAMSILGSDRRCRGTEGPCRSAGTFFFFSLKFHEVVELKSHCFFLRSHDEQVPVLDEARGGFPAL